MEDCEINLEEKIFLKYTKYFKEFITGNPIPLDFEDEEIVPAD